MDTTIACGNHRSDRRGRPLVVSPMEAVVFVLIAAALIATAALPAMARHPHFAQAKTVATAPAESR